jgi:hypothetical protein
LEKLHADIYTINGGFFVCDVPKLTTETACQLVSGVPPYLSGWLGIQDTERAGLALCLRWFWFSRTDNARSWSGLELQFSVAEHVLFFASTFMVMGDGHTTSSGRTTGSMAGR